MGINKGRILHTITKCGCNSLIPIHYISEFITSPLGPNHYNQWIHSKFSEITWCTRTPFVVMSLPLVCSTPIWGMFYCHNLVLFILCNKILLNFCFARVMFLLLFFLFHNMDLELGIAIVLILVRKSCRVICFYTCDIWWSKNVVTNIVFWNCATFNFHQTNIKRSFHKSYSK